MTKTEVTGSAAPAAGAAGASAKAASPGEAAVVTIEKKKGKQKTSRGLKDAQDLERGLTKASRRVSRAVADGLDMYLKARDKSAEKKRDGAVRDVVENWTKAFGETVRGISDAPHDVAKALNTKSVRRQARFLVRFLSPPFFR